MSKQTYLIDTNVLIGLEDNHTVTPVLADLVSLASKHNLGVFVHEAARDDIRRDKDTTRRNISLSKLRKFQTLTKVKGLKSGELDELFGKSRSPNDRVDATLLHALYIGAADFLVTEDAKLHKRAARHSAELGERLFFVADAVQLIRTTFEPIETPVRYVSEVSANSISLGDDIFESLREGYIRFDKWWKDKCVKEHRPCWIVEDEGLAGIVVRKDETADITDAKLPAKKVLKMCTFKVRPKSRGTKLGELLLRQVFWFAQMNRYDLVYLTTYEDQVALIKLLEFYGFVHTYSKADGERVYEKQFARRRLKPRKGITIYETDKQNYPRFVVAPNIRAFVVPIQEAYHDILYPDLVDGAGEGPRRPGNTIRKVYLCRAQSNLGPAGSLLFFYKGKSTGAPSQAVTTIGVLESMSVVDNIKSLVRRTGGRSVYSEQELRDWQASRGRPVKIINYLLVGYFDPAVEMSTLKQSGIFSGHPPQSITEIGSVKRDLLLNRLKLGFKV